MSEVNIREVEKDWVNALKIAALRKGETLRGYCVRVLTESLDESENLTAIPPKASLGIPPKPARRSPAATAPQKSNIGHGINCTCYQCKPVKVRPIAES